MLNLIHTARVARHPALASVALLFYACFAQPIAAQTQLERTIHSCEPPIITTVAGNGMLGDSGDEGPATQAALSPRGLAVDHQGNLYIAAGNRVRRVDAETGVITTVVGNGTTGYSGDGGPATEAQVNASVLAFDREGNLYTAGPDVVRRVDKRTGIITTVAGNGVRGYSGDGGPATGAELNFPAGLAVDLRGNLYISDTGNFRVRRVSRGTGIITTVAGNGMLGDRFRRPAGDGGPATEAPLIGPQALALDSEGNLYFADPTFVNVAGVPSGFVREVDLKTGIISTVNVTTFSPIGVAVDRENNLYVSSTRINVVLRVDRKTGVVSTVAGIISAGYSGDGGPATQAKLNAPTYLAFNRAGDLFISEGFNYRVRMIDFDLCRHHGRDRHGHSE
jgi:sugar lactone lactonase YvrE